MLDTFALQRFLDAQNPVYARVLTELRGGRKSSHWMWFIFPQVAGLGHSAMAQRYAIGSHAEASAYLADPILDARLLECTAAVLTHAGKSAHQIFGSPDDMKFLSSMTLFEAVGNEAAFRQAIDQFYGGKRDQATLEILSSWAR